MKNLEVAKLKYRIKMEAIAIGMGLVDFEKNWFTLTEDAYSTSDIIDNWESLKESLNLGVKS